VAVAIIFIHAHEAVLMSLSGKIYWIWINLSWRSVWNLFGVHTTCFKPVSLSPMPRRYLASRTGAEACGNIKPDWLGLAQWAEAELIIRMVPALLQIQCLPGEWS